MVLQSTWLLVHEIVEINELKKLGKTIHSSLLRDEPSLVFDAHLIATDWELTLASSEEDFEWIKKRVENNQI